MSVRRKYEGKQVCPTTYKDHRKEWGDYSRLPGTHDHLVAHGLIVLQGVQELVDENDLTLPQH